MTKTVVFADVDQNEPDSQCVRFDHFVIGHSNLFRISKFDIRAFACNLFIFGHL